jgi:aspartyl-tRNA(Asn)/glutamyl-tRNA(Gln) amidotransferase subunit A
VTLHARPIAALAQGLRTGEFTAEELARATLARIDHLDGIVNAFVRVEAAAAVTAARAADAELRAGLDRGLLHGIPYATKDMIDVAGLPTTCHSRSRLHHRATADAAVTERLRAAGAVLVGKVATFEFALGVTGPDGAFPPARNPWNPGHIPGGSSSGSAAGVAAGFVRFATGTCSSGSIRGPAAWCGVVGLKPSFGRVSRRGIFPLSWTMDHGGPLAASVEDAAIALQAMAGHDPLDPGSVDRPVPDMRAGLEDGVKGLRIGVPWHFFEHDPALTPDARDGIDRTLALLSDAGATIHRVTLADLPQFLACSRVIMAAEAFAIHRQQLAQTLHDYGEATVRRFALGAGVGAAEYLDAQRLRGMLTSNVDSVLSGHDALLTAISLGPAPSFAAQRNSTAWPLQASPFNVTGHPAISVPIGLDRDGLPLAVQVVGRQFDEPGVFRIARSIERLTAWNADEPSGLINPLSGLRPPRGMIPS